MRLSCVFYKLNQLINSTTKEAQLEPFNKIKSEEI